MRLRLLLAPTLATTLSLVACGGSTDSAAAPPSDGSTGGSSAGGSGAGGSSSGGTSQGGSSAGGASGGTSSGGAGGAMIPADVDAACMAYAMALCAKEDQCRDQLAQRDFGSDQECIARATAGCDASHVAPMTGTTAAGTQACAASLASADCPTWANTVVCTPVMGTIATMGACAFNGQCATGWCAVPADAVCGTCADVPKAGDDCTITNHCGPTTLVCVRGAMGASKCVEPAPMGGSCLRDADCQYGLGCVGADPKTMTSGTCQPYASTMGQACDPTGATMPRCDRDAGLYCDKATMKCAAVAVAMAGQPCGTDKITGVLTICSGKSTCVNAMGGAGTCTAPAADGAACDTMKGPPCESPAKCVVAAGTTAGTCQLPDASTCHLRRRGVSPRSCAVVDRGGAPASSVG